MGVVNVLIEGSSGTGKTTTCNELQRRGYQAIHGDRALAYWGDPITGAPLADSTAYEHWIWDVDKVRALVADTQHAITFFCGGSRNFERFIELFDAIFVLEVDLETLMRRLARRPEDEWGGKASEREFTAKRHQTQADPHTEHATIIDTSKPVADVVDAILETLNTLSPGLTDPTEL